MELLASLGGTRKRERAGRRKQVACHHFSSARAARRRPPRAESPRNRARSMSDLECSVCFYQYNDGDHEAKILPCSGAHELCLACLDQLRRTNGASFLCPVCRETIPPKARINTNRGLLAALAMMRVNVAETAATSSELVPTEPAATELTCAQPAHAIASSSTGAQCSACKQRFARGAFSRAQLGKSANTRRCKACTNGSVDVTDEVPSAPPTLAEAAPPTVTEATPPTLAETSPLTRVDASPRQERRRWLWRHRRR